MEKEQYPHLYNESSRIEEKRMEADSIYRALMDNDTTHLQKIVEDFVLKIKESHPQRSNRFDQMLSAVLQDKNRLFKHSLIFFCLFQEPWAVQYFMENHSCPPEKLSNFVAGDLKKCSEELLRGSYTSMQAYVEDVRWNYVVL